MTKRKCYICESEADIEHYSDTGFLKHRIICPRCGKYCFLDGLEIYLSSYFHVDFKEKKSKRYALSHIIANLANKSKYGYIEIARDQLEAMKDNLSLPNPAEQADNLISFIGESADFHTDQIVILPLKLAAIIGAYKEKSIILITTELKKQDLIECYRKNGEGNVSPDNDYKLSLTFKGWQIYEELKKVRKDSKQVFMAMQFGNSQLNDLFNNHLVEAVKQIGLDLRKLTDIPKDGIIDNHLRVEIRRSCLLIADLSDDNHGAYWEAGYAEGLGKPVIYLCEETKFKKESTHFDTSHLQTILWETGKEEECVKKLKDLIRVILPDKAKMEDK